jgi:hypothetical protein
MKPSGIFFRRSTFQLLRTAVKDAVSQTQAELAQLVLGCRNTGRKTGTRRRLVDANREQAETWRQANRAYSEKRPRNTKTRLRGGPVSRRTGEDQRCGNPDPPRKFESAQAPP